MKITERRERTGYEAVVVAIQCDKCKKVYADFLVETQEFYHVNFVGSYGSVFGDECEFGCDICQHCLKEMIGDIIMEIE